MNKENLIKTLLDYSLSSVNNNIIEWQGYERTKKNLKMKIENLVTKAFDAEKKTRLHILELQNRKVLLIMLDEIKNKYFVEVYFSNFSLTENPEYLIEQIKKYFPNKNIGKIYFESKRVNLSHTKIHDFIYTYAGKISIIKQAKIPENYDKIRLKKAEELSFYPEYQKMYNDYYNDYPDLNEMIGEPESMDSMKELLKNGIIKLIYIDDELAGVIIGIEMVFDVMSGYFLCEKILSKKYRGKGFGVVIERKFIDSLEISENELIFGTINVKNLASYRASTKVGRICVKVRYEIDFEEL